jgi:hypothetical protein
MNGGRDELILHALFVLLAQDVAAIASDGRVERPHARLSSRGGWKGIAGLHTPCVQNLQHEPPALGHSSVVAVENLSEVARKCTTSDLIALVQARVFLRVHVFTVEIDPETQVFADFQYWWPGQLWIQIVWARRWPGQPISLGRIRPPRRLLGIRLLRGDRSRAVATDG